MPGHPDSSSSKERVNIRPGVSVLSLFRHLNYKPWYAMAEFVDNSIQSYLSNAKALRRADGPRAHLKVEIEVESDGRRAVIRDNAAGIATPDYARAFKPAEPPPDKSGLAEFGVGMKSAACWFSESWSVRTKALGEEVERFIELDINEIVRSQKENLTPRESPASRNLHYTEVCLNSLHNPLHGRTLGKIQDHIASIYRIFLRAGKVHITFNGAELRYEEPEILVAPPFRDEKGKPTEWRKDISLKVGDGVSVQGFAAIRKTGSVSDAGLALFRRGRLILGSRDDSYRPEFIFGKSNSFTYQRLFGELNVEGAKVSHTKDGFQWADYEDSLLQALRAQLDAPPLSLLEQAEGHRVRPRPIDVEPLARAALQSTVRAAQKYAPADLAPHLLPDPSVSELPRRLQAAKPVAHEPMVIHFKDTAWVIHTELTSDHAVGDWLSVSEKTVTKKQAGAPARELEVRVSLNHPFMVRFADMSSSQMEPIVRIAIAIALAEITAREAGVHLAPAIRRNVNALLSGALSKP